MTESASWRVRHAAAATAWDITPDQLVVAACGRLRPGVALQVGTGDGGTALWLAGRGWQVTAVDDAPVVVGRLQGRSALLNQPVEAIAADVVDYRPAPQRFDLVLISYLDLPESRLRRLLSHATGGLAGGGTLLVVGHDLSNLDGGWGGPRDPDVLTTADRLTELLAGLGLEVRRAEVVRRTVPGDIGVHTVLDHVVEAVRPAA